MIYIVSGLPRSGTSMMMRMLAEGGLPVLVDADNPSTEMNPGGAYAFEPTKTLGNAHTRDWLAGADGKAVKVVSMFLPCLPKEYQYKVIFMERDYKEGAESWRQFTANHGHEVPADADRRKMEAENMKRWLARQENMDVLLVDYNGLIFDPVDSCKEIAAFLGATLDTERMRAVPNLESYRNRA
jgi:hypothetical protein